MNQTATMKNHEPKESLKAPDAFVRRIIRLSLILSLVAALLFLAAGETAWAKGLALGGLASVLNFFLMALMLPGSLGRSRRGAEAKSFLSILIRFGIMGGALIVALCFPEEFALYACAVGLFSVQICLFGDHFIRGRLST